jgi:hypothetical protein
MTPFVPPVKPRKLYVVKIADLPQLMDNSFNKCDADDDESDDSLDLGGADGKPPISTK